MGLGSQPMLASILVFSFWAMMKTTASVERRQRLQRQGNQPTYNRQLCETRQDKNERERLLPFTLFCRSVPCHDLAVGVSQWMLGPGKRRLEERHETRNNRRQDVQTRAVSLMLHHARLDLVWIMDNWGHCWDGWVASLTIAYSKTARLYMRFLLPSTQSPLSFGEGKAWTHTPDLVPVLRFRDSIFVS